MQQYHVGGRTLFIGGAGADIPGREKFISSLLFKNWLNSVSDGILIYSVEIVSIDYKPNGEPIFAKLSVRAFEGSKSGRQIIPDVVFLRGGSVAILPILVSQETGKKYVVFTSQIRLPVGEELLEIPAGMLDQDKNFVGVAAKEFREEIGIAITPADLTALTPDHGGHMLPVTFPKGIAVSPGACDETMRFYLFRKTLSQVEIDGLQGQLTGNREEGESICLKIVELERVASNTRDSKFFCAYALMHLQGLA
jgi:ADP-sugar diphosphatase